MTKAIVMKRVGRDQWEVYLNVAGALRQAPSRVHKRLAPYPKDALVPIVRTGPKTVGLVLGGQPARFTSKHEATTYAHQLGHYMLDLGSFVSTYVDEVREGSRDTRNRSGSARR